MTVAPERSEFAVVNGLSYHFRHWGDAGATPLLLLHGWMDASASFALVARTLADRFHVIAPDWRGFGRSEWAPAYWFPDYLRDLDAIIDWHSREAAVDLVGHSMGGNVACLFAGVRPESVRRLVTVEGFGMPSARSTMAPNRYRDWLSARGEAVSRTYDSADAFAARLRRLHPRLDQAKARWLAECWSEPTPEGTVRLLGDPRHRHVNPVLYRLDEAKACWRQIRCPVLWIQGDDSTYLRALEAADEDPGLSERLACFRDVREFTIAGAGHMIHLDQPVALAKCIAEFLIE